MLRKLVFATAVLASLVLAPGHGLALELGLTPSQVFSLWTNINNSLSTVAEAVADDRAWIQRLAAMTPRTFENKTPADVLGRLSRFRAKLGRFREKYDLPRIEPHSGGYANVTPSVVYLNSGRVLNGIVEWVIVNTGPEQLVSQFYVRHGFKGKTPSDVFGLIELAERRLDQVLARLDG